MLSFSFSRCSRIIPDFSSPLADFFNADEIVMRSADARRRVADVKLPSQSGLASAWRRAVMKLARKRRAVKSLGMFSPAARARPSVQPHR